jgi:hypothetical protein
VKKDLEMTIKPYPVVENLVLTSQLAVHQHVGAALSFTENLEIFFKRILKVSLYLRTITLFADNNSENISVEFVVDIAKDGDHHRQCVLLYSSNPQKVDDHLFFSDGELTNQLFGAIVKVFFDEIIASLSSEEREMLRMVKKAQPFRSRDDGWVAAKDVGGGKNVMDMLQRISDKGALLVTRTGFNGRRFKIPRKIFEMGHEFPFE